MRAASFLAAAALVTCCDQAVAQDTFLEQGAKAERAGNTRQAVLFYEMGARGREGRAAFRLGEIYEKGLGGLESDPALARMWYKRARDLGYPPLIGDFPDPKRSRDAGRRVP